MARKIKDTTAWRTTADGVAKYAAVKAEAQALADKHGRDVGIEANDLFKSWRHFSLPNRENRQGHELRCEVVSCTDRSKSPAGHGR
jgi:hypothetical protein